MLPSVCCTAEGAVGEREFQVLIDCDTCAVRDLHCGECVMTVLLQQPAGVYEVDEAEERALTALADGGLVPRLRLVPPAASAAPAAPVRSA